MKNLFGVNKKTGEVAGEKFILRRSGQDTQRRQEKLEQDVKVFERTASLPAWINWVGLIALLAGLVLLGGFLDALTEDDVTFAKAYANGGWILIVGACAFVLGSVIMIIAYIKRRRALASSAFRYLKENADKVNDEAYAALGVPEDAKAVDVITSVYRAKPGKEIKEHGFTTTFVNAEARVFKENGMLAFAFTDVVYAVPLDRILRVQRVNKWYNALGWNKEVPPNKGEYKQYRISKNNGNAISIKFYYQIIVRDENYGEYYIKIPPYDLEAVLPLTGKTVE